jgi:hypothetical protein
MSFRVVSGSRGYGLKTLLAAFAAAAFSANTVVAAEQNTMDVQAYALDQYKLVGTNVSVTGTPACLELEKCFLYAGSGSTLKPMVSVIFNASSLSKEDRRRLLHADPFSNPETATITFLAPSGMLTASMVTSISWALPTG